MVDLAPLRRGFFVRWAETRTVCAWAYSQAGSRFVSEARDRVTGGGGARPPAGAARLPCAVCNRLCGLALSRRACSLNPREQALHTKPNLAPLRRGFFCAPRVQIGGGCGELLCNQRCGAALGWRACVRERSASPVMARHMTHLAPPGGAFVWRPLPHSAGSLRMPALASCM